MSDGEQKKHAATTRKLRKQREQGSIPNSQDSAGLISTAAGLGTCAALSITFWEELAQLFDLNPFIFTLPFDEAREVGLNLIFNAMRRILVPVLIAVLATSIVITLIINKGPVLATKPVQPDLKRLSPQSGVKRIFGKRGRTEVIVATLRLLLWLGFAALAVSLILPQIAATADCGVFCQGRIIRDIFYRLVAGAIAIMILFAALDILVQQRIFLEDQKMTETELKRERKDQSMAPEIRRERNRRRQEMEEGGSVQIPLEETTILFKSAKGVVGINYAPPDQRLPLISVKAKAGDAADRILAEIASQGIAIRESDAIVANTMGKGRGEMLDMAHFREFAMAMASR